MKEQAHTKAQGIRYPKGQPKEPLKKRLFTIKEAAEYLGRSEWSIRELIWGGSLPSVKVGRRIHLDILDLDKWIEEHKTRNTY